MRFNIIILLIATTLILNIACKIDSPKNKDSTIESSALLYDKGMKIENSNFIGNAFLTGLVKADSINTNAVGNVYFEPGARSNWHLHPAGQILLVTDGEGYYQEEGSPKRILKRGDVVKCPANTPHWHGASIDREFVQIAITGRQYGPTEWLRPVTDEEYNSLTRTE